MIYIQKEKEPDAVIKWKKKFKNKYHRKPHYEDIKSEPEKQILKMALISEQKHLCCYCCNADAEDEGAKYTIELLALNDERLKGARKEAMWAAGVFTVGNEEERQQLIHKFSNTVDGRKTPFCNAILSQLRKDMESIESK